MKKAILVLNGYPVSQQLLKLLWQTCDLSICADGSYNYLTKLKCNPDIIIGDLDSLDEELLNLTKKPKILKLTDQNTTDGEKALCYLKQLAVKEVEVLGLVGSRVDHLLYNLKLFKMHQSDFSRLRLWTPSETIELATSPKKIITEIGNRISLFPFFDKVAKLTSKGLKYELKEADLSYANLVSISNQVIKSPVELSWETGLLAIFIEHNLLNIEK